MVQKLLELLGPRHRRDASGPGQATEHRRPTERTSPRHLGERVHRGHLVSHPG